MQKGPPTPKGFRDINPDTAKKKGGLITKITTILSENGFVPLETPTIEFAQTLKGKYGEEEKLIYKFKDRGGRDLALRYDLTVPLARYVANNPSLQYPFRRYQIGQVFRGENPQAGRYREFTQFDFDTVGTSNIEEDAKVIAAAIKSAKAAGLKTPTMAINDRGNFEGIPPDVIRAIDKIHKIQRKGVEAELKEKGYKTDEIEKYLNGLLNSRPTENFNLLYNILNTT
ncbi:ATP phosphoribosyltransferase regulatory subunit [Candidatus Curtissbacteria bacterium]|nr:ATP phosphoribosyltransferase regulatory subunit [Candidatus Curtissbacteria bacterium]